MDRRIRPDDLVRSPCKEIVQTLACQWVRAALPAGELVYSDYQSIISTLLLTTQNLERTATVVLAVLDQAVSLRKPADWVKQELAFEGMIEGADRADFLLFDLHQASPPDDAQLDLYNERMSRFTVDA